MEILPTSQITRRQLLSRVVSLRNAGKIYDPADSALDSVFYGSVDRYCEIAFRLHGHKKVLDVGSGTGLLLAVLTNLGHGCCGLDIINDPAALPATYQRHAIEYKYCNVEVETYPYPDSHFDGVTCCQVLEHFTHSHLPALAEMKRVLRSGGVIEIDVPNVASFRNRWRLIRGKNITWDYREHYLHAKPMFQRGFSFYPVRHNREFTRAELACLLSESGFVDIHVEFLRDRNFRTGFKKLLSIGSAARNLIPSLRKSLIAFAKRP